MTDSGDLFCSECGYNLRGLTVGRCPECGHAFDPDELRRPQIPWLYRKAKGTFRTYWRTVRLVTFRPRRFREEMSREVSPDHARAFRRATVLYVLVPFMLVGAAFAVSSILDSSQGKLDWIIIGVHAGAWLAGSGCFLLFLLGIMGVPSRFLHPQSVLVELCNRAAALSYYAAAPLVYTSLAVLLEIICTYAVVDLRVPDWTVIVCVLAMIAMPTMIIGSWLSNVAKLAGEGLEIGASERRKMGLKILGSLMLIGFLTLFFFPFGLLYFFMFLTSFF